MSSLRNAQTADEQIDIEAAPAPNDADLKRIADSARAVIKLENEIADLEAQLKQKNESLRQLQESTLPEAMRSAGLNSFELAKGWGVKIHRLITASIPTGKRTGEDLRPAAFAHLESQGAGGLIKHVIVITFGRDEDAWAKKFLRDMAQRKKPLNAKREDSVHSGTLSAYVRERLEAGVLTDEDRHLLGVYELNKALVDRPKQKLADGL